MEESGLAAIATYVMRDKQHLGCLRVREGVITLEKMYFADEIRPVDEIKPKGVSVGKQELEMARELIDRFAGSFEPEKYKDDYREALFKVIRAQAEGQGDPCTPGPEEDEAPDQMEALPRASAAAQRPRRAAARGAATSQRSLRALKDELYGAVPKGGPPRPSRCRKRSDRGAPKPPRLTPWTRGPRDELYSAALDEFIAQRTAVAKQLKGEGRADEAAEVRRRPQAAGPGASTVNPARAPEQAGVREALDAVRASESARQGRPRRRSPGPNGSDRRR